MAPLKIWIKAFRLRTLPLAMSATVLGSFLAYDRGMFRWAVFVFGLLTTLFLQVLSNLANDYGDALKGTDNHKRLGPLRVTQTGLVTRKQMRRMIALFSMLSLVSGSILIYAGLGMNATPGGANSKLYFIFFLLGLTAIFAAIKYTVGKRPYGYAGFGDIMVFIFFGIIGVSGTYFLHTHTFYWTILLPASAIGLFSVGVLNLNNLRDRENDRANGKMTLVVRMGLSWAKIYHLALLLTGFLLSLTYTLIHFHSAYQFLFVLALPFLLSDMKKVLDNTVPVELNNELKKLALTTLLFSVSFGLGLIL
jgi:1,4-dihydroxy-2-naphthoate polyprenyltransferase